MACLQIARSGLSPALGLRFAPPRRRLAGALPLPLRCRVQDAGNESNKEEPPESLFMKELKRRGMTPTSLMEESGGIYGSAEKEMEAKEEGGSSSGRGASKPKWQGVVSADYDQGLSNQRERSMALNSEGLEGLLPRAKLLLTIGGTFFLGFWPLILITITAFAVIYFYFGTSFVHDASKLPVSPPPYIDPYELLEDERLSQIAPHVN